MLKAYDTKNSPFGGLTVPSKDIVECILKLESVSVSKFSKITFRETVGVHKNPYLLHFEIYKW